MTKIKSIYLSIHPPIHLLFWSLDHIYALTRIYRTSSTFTAYQWSSGHTLETSPMNYRKSLVDFPAAQMISFLQETAEEHWLVHTSAVPSANSTGWQEAPSGIPTHRKCFKSLIHVWYCMYICKGVNVKGRKLLCVKERDAWRKRLKEKKYCLFLFQNPSFWFEYTQWNKFAEADPAYNQY